MKVRPNVLQFSIRITGFFSIYYSKYNVYSLISKFTSVIAISFLENFNIVSPKCMFRSKDESFQSASSSAPIV